MFTTLSKNCLSVGVALIFLASCFGSNAHAVTVTATTSDNGSPAHLVTWTDASGNPRSAMMVDQTLTQTGANSGYTGYLRQYTYVANGVTRTCTGRTQDNGYETSGDGFVQNHGVNNDVDDSTGNGSGFPGTTSISPSSGTFSHVTITYYIPNYIVQDASGNNQTLPTTVQWFFADGRNDPIFSITQDATATPGNLGLDSRSPYADMEYDGDENDGVIGGDAWGDNYLFQTFDQANPKHPHTLTNQSAWNDTTANTIPFAMSWMDPDATDAEMGHVATVPITVLDEGQDNEDGTPGDDPRGKSSTGGLPGSASWAYQINTYSFYKTDNTDDKHITWGANWGKVGGYNNGGSLSDSQYSEHYDDPIGSYLKGTRIDSLLTSYSVFVVLGLHGTTSNVYNASGAVGTVVTQMENVTAAVLSASIGAPVTSGPSGVGTNALTTYVTYSPAGYNPVYSTWELTASGNAVSATLKPASGKPLVNPVFLIDNYTASALPTSISINGQSVAGTNYYATVDTANQRLWVTAVGTATSNSPINLVVTVAPAISLSGNMNFGNVTVNTSARSQLTISNPGSATLTVTSISYPSGFSGDFASGTIPAGGSQIVNVTFAPTSATTYGGTITVNSTGSGPNTISASGTGVNAPTSSISLSGNLAFGNVTVNTSTSNTLTITNSGNATLNVSGITYPSGFSGDWSSGAIAAGGSQIVNVTFAPTSAITYGGNITVTSDAGGGTNTIAASGTGVTAAVADISLSGNLAFGTVPINTSTTNTLTISNPGTAPLTVSSISYPSGFSGDFASGTIPAGGSQIVNVSFAPTSTITYGGTITVNSNASGGTGTIAASGTGAVPFGGYSIGANGAYYSPWFGFYNNTYYPFIYRYDLGYIYVYTSDDTNYYLYVFNGNGGVSMGWIYTSQAFFPFVYDFTDNDFLYFFVGGTSFYNFGTNQYETY